MGQMRVLSQKGDINIEWDGDDPESVKKANEEFKKLKADGYEFFKVEKGERVERFNKKLGKLIASPGVKTAEDKKTGKRGKAMGGGPNSRLVV